MAISVLLQETSLPDFLESHYLRLPYARSGGAETFAGLASWPTIDRLLRQPALDLLIASQKLGIFTGPLPRNEAEARALLHKGYTLGFRHVQNYDPDLARLSAQFEAELSAPVDVHLYCTPASQHGFGWHYDAEEVFVLQTWGSKEWMLRKNTVNPWPLIDFLPANMAYGREIMPLQRCLLKTNDWLYIPSGYWHSTKATEESISLSIGVLAPSGIDFFNFVRDQLVNDIRWRQRLPHAIRRDDLEGRLAELASDLAKHLARPEIVERFLQASKPSGASFAAPI